MNYSCYKEAFSALIAENDGVLPDLYEEINITIFCHPAGAPPLLTVADVVAYAIIEASNEFCTPEVDLHPVLSSLPPTPTRQKAVGVDCLLTQLVTSYN